MNRLPNVVPDRNEFPLAIRPPQPETGAPPTPGDIMGMLRRRLLMITTLFLLFSALSVAGFFLWWTYFPGFQGECLIECISNIPETELSLEQERLKQDEHERFVQTQATLLKSPRVLSEALKVNAVRETGWFQSVRTKNEEPLIRLDEDLSAAPIRGTNLLRVAIECRNPDDPATIVNEVVNQWYHDVKKRAAEEYTNTQLEQANKDQDEVERRIAAMRERVKEIAQRLPAGAMRNPAANIVAMQVLQYGEQVSKLELELAQLDQYRQIYSDPDGGPITAEDRAIVEQDPQVAELARAVFVLEQRRASDLEVFGPEHKEVRQTDAQLKAAIEKLEELRRAKLRERKADIREAANTAFSNTQHALLIARENLAKAEATLHDQDRLMFDYYELQGQLGKELRYEEELVDYIRGLERVKGQQTAVRVNIAQPAIKPLERSSPTILVLPFGVFLSLLLATALGLAVELLDKSVRTSQDITRHLDLAMLGAVPHTDDEEVPIEQVETAVRDKPRSMVAEAFRRIRTNLQFSAPPERQRSVVVTSPQPEDGATTVAVNLALAAAQAGRRVLLVDANLRRPRLATLFRQVPPEGLSNVLIGQASVQSSAAKTDHPLLDVLGSGPIPPNPAELLGGQHWRNFLAEAAKQYDQVIIDSPPVLLASDSTVLATSVDGVVLVVRAKRDSRGVARRALTQLSDVGAHIFGAVLNAAQVARGGYYRKQLRAYYDYQPGAESAGEQR
jgi:capsular exopolysaccharide synthesis family protein